LDFSGYDILEKENASPECLSRAGLKMAEASVAQKSAGAAEAPRIVPAVLAAFVRRAFEAGFAWDEEILLDVHDDLAPRAEAGQAA